MSPTEPPSTRWVFPDPSEAEDEVVAVGADLEPGTLLSAYRQGIFPMPLSDTEQIAWWSPTRRGILPIDGLRVSRSLRRSSHRLRVTIDQAYDDVVVGCSDRSRPGAWIDDRIKTAYRALFELGWAHSVEVWDDDVLAGGLYGVAVNGLFAGESMFHDRRDASKVALMALIDLLDDGSPGRILDVQWTTDHLMSLGAIEVSRSRYLEALRRALALPLPAIWR
ncbi:MAG: leucyl/phenylalanyl-tRNA--protein transferase [Nocardioidaceae bacterium]